MGEEGFYDLSSPTYPQQGDIFPNVPLISPPPSRYLIVLRDTSGYQWQPSDGVLQASSEQFLNAFDGGPEYVAVSAERGLAVILTQTCDLGQDLWLVCPLLAIEGSGISEGNLLAGKYANLLGMPKHPLGHFDAGYLDLSKCFAIRRECVHLADRIASLTLDAQNALTDKMSETLTRMWGHAPGDAVPQTGKYRCIRCFQFHDVENNIMEFSSGEKFPDCANCSVIRKRAQWRLLRKHKRY